MVRWIVEIATFPLAADWAYKAFVQNRVDPEQIASTEPVGS
jgi:hypothetical protein